MDGAGTLHEVMAVGTTYLNFVEAGTLTYHDNKISCTGTKVQVEGGETYNSAVKLVDMKISVSIVKMEGHEEGYLLPDAHLLVRWDELKEGGIDLGLRGRLVVEASQPEGRTGCRVEL